MFCECSLVRIAKFYQIQYFKPNLEIFYYLVYIFELNFDTSSEIKPQLTIFRK